MLLILFNFASENIFLVYICIRHLVPKLCLKIDPESNVDICNQFCCFKFVRAKVILLTAGG